jgi:hypothetical protein
MRRPAPGLRPLASAAFGHGDRLGILRVHGALVIQSCCTEQFCRIFNSHVYSNLEHAPPPHAVPPRTVYTTAVVIAVRIRINQVKYSKAKYLTQTCHEQLYAAYYKTRARSNVLHQQWLGSGLADCAHGARRAAHFSAVLIRVAG